MKTIICITDNAEIMVDDEDFHWLSRFPWYRGGTGQHPMTFLYGKNGKGRPVYMHQLIMGGIVNTDHKDMNVLNMQKDNLRPATYSLNGANRVKSLLKNGKPTSSKYKGVNKPAGSKKFIAIVCKDRKIYRCGSYINEDEAALAYNKKAKELFGNYARLNEVPEFNNINGLQCDPTKG